jgi:hypothetical protein
MFLFGKLIYFVKGGSIYLSALNSDILIENSIFVGNRAVGVFFNMSKIITILIYLFIRYKEELYSLIILIPEYF